MTKPLVSYRRIDRLKAIAFERGFTNEDAKQFGKLSKTATWEALLELYLVDGESLDTMLDNTLDAVDRSVDTVDRESRDTSGWINDGSSPVCSFTPQNSLSFLDWVDFAQLVAFVLASAGVFVLAMSMWRQINPLNLIPPVRVNIQIGAK
ncbi:hypothetical protein [Microcoleus sp. Pol17_C1]|uniref:hypothetical protein n=1 Tax=unclassified Microcoleus TaxID=2642155 RepID=UPI002FD38084